MKFKCARDNLLSILNIIAKAVAIKPSTPALGGIYLKVVGDNLEVQANNYILGMSAKIIVESERDGEVVVIGKKFLDVVRAMPDAMLTVSREIGSNYLEISVGKSSYSIATFNIADFPKVTQNDAESSFIIEAGVLKNLINRTVFACAKEENYPIYTGCLFDIKDDSINVAATNMHRLAVASAMLTENSNPMRFIVPGDVLRNISEMLPDDDSRIRIDYFGKNVSFDINQVFVKARIIDGNYPDYQRVIPTSSSSFVEVDVESLRDAVERLSIISREDINKKMTFKFAPMELELSATSPEIGTGTETIPSKLDGATITISFNSSYLLDVLKVLRDGKCKISMDGELGAADIRPIDDEQFVYVVTPVRG